MTPPSLLEPIPRRARGDTGSALVWPLRVLMTAPRSVEPMRKVGGADDADVKTLQVD